MAVNEDWELDRLSEAVDALAALDPRLARVVDLKFFCGLFVRGSGGACGNFGSNRQARLGQGTDLLAKRAACFGKRPAGIRLTPTAGQGRGGTVDRRTMGTNIHAPGSCPGIGGAGARGLDYGTRATGRRLGRQLRKLLEAHDANSAAAFLERSPLSRARRAGRGRRRSPIADDRQAIRSLSRVVAARARRDGWRLAG